jgi:nicotinamide riboside transporter PnuC
MIEIAGWICTIIAVTGVVLNNHKRRSCFSLWLFSNGISCAIHVAVGVWSLAARDAIFFGLAIEGLWLWQHK